MRRFFAATRKATEPKAPSSLSQRFKTTALTLSVSVLVPVSGAGMSKEPMSTNSYATLQQAIAAGNQDTLIRVKAPNCINITEAELARVPSIKPVFEQIAAQPITGAPIMARLRDPAHRFQICLDPSLPGNGVLAAYMAAQNRLFVPVLDADFESVAHESYHAYQDTLGGIVMGDAPLHPRDMAMSRLLAEASAVGYTLMLMREIGYSDPEAYASFIAPENKNAFGMGARFDAAYTASYAANPDLDETTRRKVALQAGGTAVVDSLLSAEEPGWSRPYAFSAMQAAQNGDLSVDTTRRQYRDLRDEQFRRAGSLGDINIIPLRFLGPNAQAQIAQAVDATGIEITRVPAPEFNARTSSPRMPRS